MPTYSEELEMKLSEANVEIEKTVELNIELREANKEKEHLIEESDKKTEENKTLVSERNELLLILKEKEDKESIITREIQEVKEQLQIQSNTKDSLAEKLQNASSQHERLIQVS